MICKGLVNNTPAEMLIDTCSVFTIIHYNLLKEIETRSQSKILVATCKSTVVSANSEIIDIHGVIDVTISIKGVRCKQTILINCKRLSSPVFTENRLYEKV